MRFPKNTRILGWQRNWIQITNQKESEHPEGGRQKSQQHNQTKPKRKGQQRKKKRWVGSGTYCCRRTKGNGGGTR